MKLSNLLSKTKREAPSNVELISHALMLRSGMIHQTASGLYAWAPMGLRVLRNVERIVREEMDKAGAAEVLLPTIQTADLWEQSGRLDAYGPEMLRFKDRHKRDILYGPTAEEAFTAFFRDYGAGKRDLGSIIYQIQTKFRDEIRPRHGVMRSREFLMKDAYSFDEDEAGAQAAYERMRAAYIAVFKRIGVEANIVEADSGAIGGTSHEFQIGDIEVGHIFSFGTKYSEKLNLQIDTGRGRIFPHMGSYGIGISRVVAAYIENNHDDKGMIWPKGLAPFDIVVIPVTKNAFEIAAACYEKLKAEGNSVLFDDRDARAGEKFNDAELLGLPHQYIFGAKSHDDLTFEWKRRADGDTQVMSIRTILDVSEILDVDR